jgi:hypothetical protein
MRKRIIGLYAFGKVQTLRKTKESPEEPSNSTGGVCNLPRDRRKKPKPSDGDPLPRDANVASNEMAVVVFRLRTVIKRER